MAFPARPNTRSLLTLAIAGVLALGLSRTGLADPWMAFVSDTGLFDTGSFATDDTGSPGGPVDTGEPDDAADDPDDPGTGDDTGDSGGDDTGDPGGDDTGGPGGDDTGEPGGDDTGEPGGDDTGDPGGDDTGAPGGDDTGDPGDDDTGDPEEDVEPVDTGGKSAAELAGETGGCGCATSSPPSGIIAVLIALGLVTRRRSVS